MILISLLVGTLALVYSLHNVKASTTTYIRADGNIDPSSAPILRSADVYTLTGNINSDADGIVIERNNTILDGAGYTLQGTKAPSSIGIYLSGNYNVTIKNMKIKTFEYGILFDTYSTCNRILGNKVEGNEYGINCWGFADNNSIAGNNVTANDLVGIWIVGSSNSNVTENRIVGNNQYGISLEGSSSTTIYHNSLIDNPDQVSIYDSAGAWDNGYPSGGNYWSDHSGADSKRGLYQNETGSDGIIDIEHTIDGDNTDHYPLVNTWTPPDIAVTNTTTSKTVVAQNHVLNISVTLRNQGNKVEGFNVQVYANVTSITSQNIILTNGSSAAVTFTWNTSGFARAYVISAHVSPLEGETDLSDNTFVYGIVRVTCLGDVNGDYVADAKDYQLVKKAIPSTPGSPKWNPNANMNDDLTIDAKDYQLVKKNIPSQLP